MIITNWDRKNKLSHFVINLKWMVGGQVTPMISIIIDTATTTTIIIIIKIIIIVTIIIIIDSAAYSRL